MVRIERNKQKITNLTYEALKDLDSYLFTLASYFHANKLPLSEGFNNNLKALKKSIDDMEKSLIEII